MNQKHFLRWRIRFRGILGTIIGIIIFSSCSVPSREARQLKAGFENPPESARPRVWWHWMNGNISKEGIRADLLWMHRIGIGGFQNFDAALNTPQIVEKRLVYMTPEWKEAFLYATRLADSLGLEMAIAGSPGWSESGGPWVEPRQAMKKYVWSETRAEGGKKFHGILPEPCHTTGPFQNLRIREAFSMSGLQPEVTPEYYADAAVVAYRLPESDLMLAELSPVVKSSGGRFTLEQLTDGDLTNSSLLPYTKPGENAWIMYDFGIAHTAFAVTVVGGGYAGQFGFGADENPRTLEVSDDGKTFRKVFDIPVRGIEQKTLSFSPVTARYFRFTWRTPVPRQAADIGAAFGFASRQASAGPSGTNIAELVIHSAPRINHFEEKAAFATSSDLYSLQTPLASGENVIRKSDVIDLTSLMKNDGSLEWTPPEGRWSIIRLGCSLTGHKNSPASPEATGLEVDKMNASHVKDYFTKYLDQYKDATGGLMGERGLKYLITDSWEAGVANWTDSMMTEFEKRRGYSMIPWLPVLSGKIVESTEESEKFLWDFRKTIGDLTVENHYDQLTEILRERGMARYSESHESGRALIADGMEVKRKADIPMSATWTPGGLDPGTEVATRYKADVRESASVAHIWGQNIVAAESMTAIGSAWAWSPELLKPTADMEMANGLNRFVIHTSVHQPVDDKIPGLGLGPFGQWFTRHETWAEQAPAWISYLSRSSFMLQQGIFVADIAWYYGEDNNITSLYGAQLPAIPRGYNYDFVNADAIINMLKAGDGVISTASGMNYKLLVLDSNAVYMSLPVLAKLERLVKEGAVISGPKPELSPSLSDNSEEFKLIAGKMWPSEKGVFAYGKGKIYAGLPVGDVLAEIVPKPDFKYSAAQPDAKVLFVHRKARGIDIYWINNRYDRDEKIDAVFRIDGKTPEIWDPVSGSISPVSYNSAEGATSIQLSLSPDDAVFVVFRKKTGKTGLALPVPRVKELYQLPGGWDLTFQEGRGAPASARLEKLESLSENTDKGIRYFSGTVSYRNSVEVPGEWLKTGDEIWIDLGEVKNLAEVLVNDKSLGVVWKKPFRINATSALREGENNLEISVTNLWVNRLIGDAQPDAANRITYTTMQFYRAESPLKQSGLLGPVKIYSTEN